MTWREPPQRTASARAATHAKILRRSLTEPEKRLWRHLRHRLPIEGSHFRRQVALGPYVADFCCLSARLIIEIDGGQHGFDHNVAYDETRTAALAQQGFRVIRFTNADVLQDIETVLDTVFAVIASADAMTFARQPGGATPTPGPSPQGGGE